MSNASAYADQLIRELPSLKPGTLRFWGRWFGRPYDNCHYVVGCEAQDEVLRLRFHDAEVLSVWSPVGLDTSQGVLRISDAARVRWEWFYYGRPQIASNLYFLDFVKGRPGTSNVDWYVPELTPLMDAIAVEIVVM